METESTKTLTFNPSLKLITKLYPPATTDFCFTFKNGQISVHKTLLSSLSPVFEAMFSGQWIETNSVEIIDTSPAAFKDFMQYFYKCAVDITEENYYDLIYLAKKYHVEELYAGLEAYMIECLTPDNVIDSLGLALFFSLNQLKFECEQRVSANMQKILKSPALLGCELNGLRTIFKLMPLGALVYNRQRIFDFSIRWADKQCQNNNIDANQFENLQKQLDDVYALICLNDTDAEEFRKRFEQFKMAARTNRPEQKYNVCSYCQPMRIQTLHRRSATQLDFEVTAPLLLMGVRIAPVLIDHGVSANFTGVVQLTRKGVVVMSQPFSGYEEEVLFSGEDGSREVLIETNLMYELKVIVTPRSQSAVVEARHHLLSTHYFRGVQFYPGTHKAKSYFGGPSFLAAIYFSKEVEKWNT